MPYFDTRGNRVEITYSSGRTYSNGRIYPNDRTEPRYVHYRNINISETFKDFLYNRSESYHSTACYYFKSFLLRELDSNSIETIDNEVLYNVAYCSELNPIEMVFSKVKSIVHKRNNNENILKLINNINYGFNCITKDNLNGYYNKCLSF